MVWALKLQLGEGDSLVESLNALIKQVWTTQVVNGQTVVSTSEAGGSVTFTFERGYTPAQLAVMAREGLDWVMSEKDPENPRFDLPHYNRTHVTFHKAVL